MKPHFWMPIVALVGLTGVAHAQPPQYGYGPAPYGAMPYARPAYAAPRVSPAAEAAGVLREGMEKLLTYLQTTDENKLQVAAYLDREIAPYFDFDHMAKWVAGARWQRMGAEQREAMAADLEARFLSTLAKQLAEYEGQQVRYLRPRAGGRGAVSVPVGILRPGSYPSKLEFRMYKGDEGWKVYDVVANGRSASAYYRTQLTRASMPPQGGSYGR